MSNGIYLTLEQYKDKDLPLTITVNGNTYHSQFALATTQTTWFEMGKQHGMELGADNTYSEKEMSRMHDAWYDEGYEAGKRDQFNDDNKLIDESNERNIKLIDEVHEKSRKLGYDEGYDVGYNDGYEQCKHDGISKINLNTESVEQTELSKEYDKGFTKGYEEGKSEGYEEGYQKGLWINLVLKK
jgi:flagellar biosynthesis/type III secretory pathway protein FliH